MLPFDRKLARTSVDVFAATAGEDYARLMEMLNSNLGATAINSLEESERQSIDNRKLILDATYLFPKLEPFKKDTAGFEGGNNYLTSPFIVGSQGEAKFLQHNLVWFYPSSGTSMPGYPYYIVGIRPNEKETHLIAVKAMPGDPAPKNEDGPWLTLMKFRTRDIRMYLKAKQQQLGTPYAQQQLETAHLYNPETNNFLIDQQSPGSWTARQIGVFSYSYLNKVADSDMAHFDIIGQLTKISTMFGVNKELQGLIDPNTVIETAT